jgi:hypothetical protein
MTHTPLFHIFAMPFHASLRSLSIIIIHIIVIIFDIFTLLICYIYINNARTASSRKRPLNPTIIKIVSFELMKKFAILPEIPSCILFYLDHKGRAIRFSCFDISAKKRKLELTKKDFHYHPSRGINNYLFTEH